MHLESDGPDFAEEHDYIRLRPEALNRRLTDDSDGASIEPHFAMLVGCIIPKTSTYVFDRFRRVSGDEFQKFSLVTD